LSEKIEIYKILNNFFKELQKDNTREHQKDSSSSSQLKINELIKMGYDPSKIILEKPDTDLVDIKPYQTLVVSRSSW
jgi:hypothetical protein